MTAFSSTRLQPFDIFEDIRLVIYEGDFNYESERQFALEQTSYTREVFKHAFSKLKKKTYKYRFVRNLHICSTILHALLLSIRQESSTGVSLSDSSKFSGLIEYLMFMAYWWRTLIDSPEEEFDVTSPSIYRLKDRAVVLTMLKSFPELHDVLPSNFSSHMKLSSQLKRLSSSRCQTELVNIYRSRGTRGYWESKVFRMYSPAGEMFKLEFSPEKYYLETEKSISDVNAPTRSDKSYYCLIELDVHDGDSMKLVSLIGSIAEIFRHFPDIDNEVVNLSMGSISWKQLINFVNPASNKYIKYFLVAIANVCVSIASNGKVTYTKSALEQIDLELKEEELKRFRSNNSYQSTIERQTKRELLELGMGKGEALDVVAKKSVEIGIDLLSSERSSLVYMGESLVSTNTGQNGDRQIEVNYTWNGWIDNY